MEDQQKQWAMALKKAQNDERLSKIPLDMQKKQNQDEIQHFKKMLLAACKAKDVDEASALVSYLVKLRAKKISLYLLEKKQSGATIKTDNIEKQIQFYLQDSANLFNSAIKLLRRYE